MRRRELSLFLPYLRSLGLDPIIGKGWAIARFYPEPGMRPYADFDLYIQSSQYDDLNRACTDPACPPAPRDIHRESTELNDRPFDEIHCKSESITLGETEVRVFGPEDHLRLLSLHMLRHGAWRPLWLCDIAIALEKRPANFDWDYFLSGDPVRTHWVICAIGLAHELLGADLVGTPIEEEAKQLPRWLLPTVLRQWGRIQFPHGARTPIRHYLKNPKGLWKALLIRWPNGIEASVDLHTPFNNFPRLPLQIADCFYRTYRFIHSLVTSV